MATKQLTAADFKTDAAPWWCPGCGDFAVLAALQRAAVELELIPEKTVLVSGIGCSGKISDYFNVYGVHVLHGRTMPVATGIKLANRDLTVIAVGGDGDGFGIGLGHFMHTARRNVDLTYIVMDNQIYGLTKGQFSPTSAQGFKTITSPEGAAERPVQPLVYALAAGVTFLAQGFSRNIKQLQRLIIQGVRHKGFSLINTYSPCVTYNRINTYEWFEHNLINLDDDPDYDPTDRAQAMQKVLETNGLLTGLIYADNNARPFEAWLPGFPDEPLTVQNLELPPETWQAHLEEFR